MGKHGSWVFADGDRFLYGNRTERDENGLVGNVRIVSTRPEADGSLGPVLRGESDFLVVDVEGNYAGRLPQDAAMYRTHGRHFRHHPDRGYRAPGTGVPIEHVDERLKAILMQAGEEWGPRGVAEAAAQMAGWVGPF